MGPATEPEACVPAWDEEEFISWAELSGLGRSIVRRGLSFLCFGHVFPHHQQFRCHSVLHEGDVFDEAMVQAGLILPGLLG